MQIGIMGSGVTAQTIGTKLIQLGHEVMLGSRDEANPPSVVWARDQGQHALYGTFMNAAVFGEIIFNCTLGSASLAALNQAGVENLSGKVLIDTANPIDRANVMVDPAKLLERTHVFVSGNDIEAKATVVRILRDWFGWKEIIDLGGIETARGVEMYVLLWHNLRNAISSQRFNIKVVTSG
jgi:predicted dinucleotide-binding enzyme